MKVLRLTKIAEIYHLWDFFRQGLEETARYLKYDFSLDTYRQIIQHLVRDDSAWVGVVFLDNKPIGFAIAHDCTPLFSTRKEYEVSLIYHRPGNDEATRALQSSFELFCTANNISTYYATTRRDNGAAIRCFQSPQYGFKRAYTVFKKSLT